MCCHCPYCDPDGADTATLWGQWQHKRRDPALDGYRRLVDDLDEDEVEADDGAEADEGGAVP